MPGTEQVLKKSIAALLVLGVVGLAVVGGGEPDPVLEPEAAAEPGRPGNGMRLEPQVPDGLPDLDEGDAVAAPRVTVAPAAGASTTTSASVAGAGPSTPARAAGTRPPAPADRPATGTQVVEKSDTTGEFTYREAAVADERVTPGEPGLVRFDLVAAVVEGHGRVSFSVVNQSGGEIAFPGGTGAVVRIAITRPDETVKVYEVRAPETHALADGGRIDGELDFPLTADGTYAYAGEVLVEYR